MELVPCPICDKGVQSNAINEHIDSGCTSHLDEPTPLPASSTQKAASFTNFFKTSSTSTPIKPAFAKEPPRTQPLPAAQGRKRSYDFSAEDGQSEALTPNPAKKPRPNAFEKVAPLAERMRPKTLDEVCGQELVGKNGILRGLIEAERVPSMVLWGGPGTGKTTIARLIARVAGTRFVEINSTSSGVAECKKIFAEARNELALTGRKTIVFCDEIHRFSKSQQDVFLGPVEAGHVTLIGATTENPSFKVVNALLSRCRTFTLSRLTDEDLVVIMRRALDSFKEDEADNAKPDFGGLLGDETLKYLADFADGDARTALNLLELASDLATRPGITVDEIKRSLTHTLVYDRSGDAHYDTISALHKSVRGSDPDAAVYYLARMLQSGEDPLFVARRMVVMASEDIGLADNTMLTLATSTYSACEKIGMPECRINLAHCAVALSLAPKSTRSYRALNNAYAALAEPGIAALPIPLQIRNAPTKLMKEIGYGKEYKYNPHYLEGKVVQEYLPEKIRGRQFLEELDLGTKIDPDLEQEPQEHPLAEAGREESKDDEDGGLGYTSFTVGDGNLELPVD